MQIPREDIDIATETVNPPFRIRDLYKNTTKTPKHHRSIPSPHQGVHAAGDVEVKPGKTKNSVDGTSNSHRIYTFFFGGGGILGGVFVACHGSVYKVATMATIR